MQNERDAGVVAAARVTIRDALMDSQYLAGVKAGWNAAQDANPESALASLQQSRSGHLAGYAEAKSTLATRPPAPEDAGTVERVFVVPDWLAKVFKDNRERYEALPRPLRESQFSHVRDAALSRLDGEKGTE